MIRCLGSLNRLHDFFKPGYKYLLVAGARATVAGLKSASEHSFIGKLANWIPFVGAAKDAGVGAIEETVMYLT